MSGCNYDNLGTIKAEQSAPIKLITSLPQNLIFFRGIFTQKEITHGFLMIIFHLDRVINEKACIYCASLLGQGRMMRGNGINALLEACMDSMGRMFPFCVIVRMSICLRCFFFCQGHEIFMKVMFLV